MRVGEILDARRQREPGSRLQFDVTRDPLPMRVAIRGSVHAVVVIGHEGHLVSRLQRQQAVQQMALVAGAGLLRAHHVVLDKAQRPGIEDELEAAGLAGIVVDDVVPAVDQKSGQRYFVRDRQSGARSKVVVRDGPGEQDTAGVVPVGASVNHLGAVLRNELAEIQRQPSANVGAPAQVVLHEVRPGGVPNARVAAVDPIGRRTKSHLHVVAQRTRFAGGFGHLEIHLAEGQRIVIEIKIPIGDFAARRGVEIVAVIGVDESAKLDPFEKVQPFIVPAEIRRARLQRRGHCRCRRSRGG